MNRDDEHDLTEYWTVETVALNERVDAAFASAQNHAYSLGYVRGTQETNAELFDVLSQIMADLPSRRDWLDPVLEQRAKDAIANAKGREER